MNQNEFFGGSMKAKRKNTGITFFMLALVTAIAVSACQPKAPAEPTPDANMIFTQAAITVAAQLTRTALSMPTATPTATLEPTSTPELPTATLEATLPVETQANTSLTQVAATAPNPNKMEFIGDVTIPDGQIVPAGGKFVKTWKLKNTGSTTWTENFKLRLWAGQSYGAATSILLGKEVKSNTETEISIEFTAPTKAGEYISMWILSDSTEANFGVPFYVKFVVGTPATATATSPAEATATTAATTAVVVPSETPTEAPTETPTVTPTP
ncbi:MAG: hypothetical protein CVU39_05975 [Chloroflexi bacterium HGW-Chloroflexi-10]|nr:MAG: hypothetical protein CVU39_05975 [Chloroflexi bacterium HGW-Chloroflexi-10]